MNSNSIIIFFKSDKTLAVGITLTWQGPPAIQCQAPTAKDLEK